MRISEKQAKNLLRFPLGLVAEFKGDFSLKPSVKLERTIDLEKLSEKAFHYKVLSGKVVEVNIKE